MIVRYENVVVPAPSTLYCMAKVFDPAFRPVSTVVVLAWMSPMKLLPKVLSMALPSFGVAPFTETLAHALWDLSGATLAVTITIALVSVVVNVNVTDGLVSAPTTHVPV